MKVAIRVDSSVRTGNGHLVRCLGLAKALSAHAEVIHFVSARLKGSIAARASEIGYGFTWLTAPVDGKDPADFDEMECLKFAQLDSAAVVATLGLGVYDALVVDHYALGREWESAVRRVARHIACIDDLADRAHDCDLLVDHNPGRYPGDYGRLLPRDTCSLLGPSYALLREEFLAVRAAGRVVRAQDEPTQLLVSMGGTDPDNATLDVLDGLDASRFPSQTKVRVILGPSAPGLYAIAERLGKMRLACELVVDPPNFARLTADCDAAIGAGGVSALERCCLGVPSLVVVVAGNQRRSARALESLGAVLGVVERGHVREAVAALDPSLPSLNSVARVGMDLVDGRGVVRVANAIRQMCNA